jgi:uncharacterized membrane protein
VVLALYDALRLRSLRQGRRLFQEVRERLLSFDGPAPVATPPNAAKRTPWFRPSVIFSVAGVVLAGIAQGVCHAVGFHLWEPIWRNLQQLTIRAKDRYGCATRGRQGTCSNARTISRQELERRVLDGLRGSLLTPEL